MIVRVLYYAWDDECRARLSFLGLMCKDLPVYSLYSLHVRLSIIFRRKPLLVLNWQLPLSYDDYIAMDCFYGFPAVTRYFNTKIKHLLYKYKPLKKL